MSSNRKFNYVGSPISKLVDAGFHPAPLPITRLRAASGAPALSGMVLLCYDGTILPFVPAKGEGSAVDSGDFTITSDFQSVRDLWLQYAQSQNDQIRWEDLDNLGAVGILPVTVGGTGSIEMQAGSRNSTKVLRTFDAGDAFWAGRVPADILAANGVSGYAGGTVVTIDDILASQGSDGADINKLFANIFGRLHVNPDRFNLESVAEDSTIFNNLSNGQYQISAFAALNGRRYMAWSSKITAAAGSPDGTFEWYSVFADNESTKAVLGGATYSASRGSAVTGDIRAKGPKLLESWYTDTSADTALVGGVIDCKGWEHVAIMGHNALGDAINTSGNRLRMFPID